MTYQSNCESKSNKMNEFKDFISSLTDHELAIFFGYRYNAFLENSQKKIDEQIKNRNLSSAKLELLKESKLGSDLSKESKTCPRCGSDRLFVESDYTEIPVSEVASAEIATDSYRCRLCGYNADKTRPKNFAERIKRMLGRSRRVNKWNEI